MPAGILSTQRPTVPLTEARAARGLSREALAALAGVSVRTLYNHEVGGQRPHRATQRVIALALGIAIDDLFPTKSSGGPTKATAAENEEQPRREPTYSTA